MIRAALARAPSDEPYVSLSPTMPSAAFFACRACSDASSRLGVSVNAARLLRHDDYGTIASTDADGTGAQSVTLGADTET